MRLVSPQPFFGMSRNAPPKVSLGGTLRDIPKNGCGGDYCEIGYLENTDLENADLSALCFHSDKFD